MYKIAAIGDRESVMGFASLGLNVFEASTRDETNALLHKLAKNGFGVIYITEQLSALVPETVAHFRSEKLPAIIEIPGLNGNTGSGMRGVHGNVEKAVGSDILNN